jgi:hypothetical protein
MLTNNKQLIENERSGRGMAHASTDGTRSASGSTGTPRGESSCDQAC